MTTEGLHTRSTIIECCFLSEERDVISDAIDECWKYSSNLSKVTAEQFERMGGEITITIGLGNIGYDMKVEMFLPSSPSVGTWLSKHVDSDHKYPEIPFLDFPMYGNIPTLLYGMLNTGRRWYKGGLFRVSIYPKFRGGYEIAND
jgi:hypothetical protein